MSELEYSNDAINILAKFYNTDAMLFVEGDEDIPFWEFMFEKFTSISVEVQAVGGKPKLEQYAIDIMAGTSNALVAMDNDYSIFDSRTMHSNVVHTYGYSIENTIISTSAIQKAIRSLGRIPSRLISEQQISDWLSDFSKMVEPILIYDIGNHLHQHGCCIAGSNCSRFMKNKSSPFVCANKVNGFVDDAGFTVTDEEMKSSLKIMRDAGVSVLDMIRGHFIFSAVHRFVVAYIKRNRSKISISHESMFAALILSFERIFDENHSHFEYYESVLSKVSIVV